MEKPDEKQLSSAETELYDRQIRLWGIESQEKLRAANVLLIGVRGLGSEIAKNILLSGINSLTILDDGIITEEDTTRNFLLSHDSPIGGQIAEEVLVKAQALNPLVKLVADCSSVTSKTAKFYAAFTMVVATGIKFENVLKIDGICRENNVKFIYGDTFGMFAFCVLDLEDHDFYEDRVHLPKNRKRTLDAEKTTIRVQTKIVFPPLSKVLVLPNTKQELNPVRRIARAATHLFVCMLTLIEFRRQHDRNPDITKKAEDMKELKTITSEVINLYKLPKQKMDHIYDKVFGQVPPVCAILGGVMAQEVIKAVSQKEVPINNLFLFDPITYSGKELIVGL